jgi:hypothetical protein
MNVGQLDIWKTTAVGEVQQLVRDAVERPIEQLMDYLAPHIRSEGQEAMDSRDRSTPFDAVALATATLAEIAGPPDRGVQQTVARGRR